VEAIVHKIVFYEHDRSKNYGYEIIVRSAAKILKANEVRPFASLLVIIGLWKCHAWVCLEFSWKSSLVNDYR